MPDVETQKMRDRMHVADGDKTRVVDLLAYYRKRTHQSFPSRKDVRCFRQQRESCLKRRRMCFRVDNR